MRTALLTFTLALACVNIASASPKSGTIYVYDLTYTYEMDPQSAYEEVHFVAALQGLVNRDAAQLYAIYMGVDEMWLDYCTSAWLAGVPIVNISTRADLIATFPSYFTGVVLYDPNVPSTSNLASTAAGVLSLLPVCYRNVSGSLYQEVVLGGSQLPVLLNLVDKFNGSISGSAKCDAHLWAKAQWLDTNMTDPTYLAYYIDYWWTTVGPNTTQFGGYSSNTVSNHDYFISHRAFFWDLDVWADQTPIDDPTQPLGTDQKTLLAILQSAYMQSNSNGAQNMIVVGGFTPWAFKYVNSQHGGVPTEWQSMVIFSGYNVYIDADACCIAGMANAAFYQHFPLRRHYVQNHAPRLEQFIHRGYVTQPDLSSSTATSTKLIDNVFGPHVVDNSANAASTSGSPSGSGSGSGSGSSSSAGSGSGSFSGSGTNTLATTAPPPSTNPDSSAPYFSSTSSIAPEVTIVPRMYLSFYVGDYDSAAWVYNMLRGNWDDPRRGEVPLGWAVDPNLSRRFPLMFEHMFDTLTVNDRITTGDSGAGYINPTQLFEPRNYSGLPDGTAAWVNHCTPLYSYKQTELHIHISFTLDDHSQFGMSFTGFVINGYSGDMTCDAQELYTSFSWDGMTDQTDYAPKEVPYLQGNTPVFAECDLPAGGPEAAAEVILGQMSGGLQFNVYRGVLRNASYYAEIMDLLAEHDIVVLEPIWLSYLARLALGGNNNNRFAYIDDDLPSWVPAAGATISLNITVLNNGWNTFETNGLCINVTMTDMSGNVVATGMAQVPVDSFFHPARTATFTGSLTIPALASGDYQFSYGLTMAGIDFVALGNPEFTVAVSVS